MELVSGVGALRCLMVCTVPTLLRAPLCIAGPSAATATESPDRMEYSAVAAVVNAAKSAAMNANRKGKP